MYAGRFVVFLAYVLFCILNVSESKERSKNGCVVCGKKSQGSPFRHVEKNEELEVCFGVRASGNICEASLRSRHLEVVGERDNGRVQGRHARGEGAPARKANENRFNSNSVSERIFPINWSRGSQGKN